MQSKIWCLLKCQLLYLISRKNPDRNAWVFSSVDNCNFNYNSKYLFLYVKEHFPNITPYYVINDGKLRKELGKKYGEQYFIETNTVKGIRKVLRAGIWFTSAGLPVYAVGLGKKYDIINLWHGIPLKKIALLEENVSKYSKIYFKKIFSENYRYLLTGSQELVPIMAESFGVGKEKVKVWGQPRNDCLFQTTERQKFLESIYEELPEYERVILYAPTYRDNDKTRIFPFPDLDMAILEKFLEEHKILLLLRMHLQEAKEKMPWKTSRILDMNADKVEDVSEMLNIFDLLITDYSSIYIDYLLLDRPIIFLPYDKEIYLSERGMNFVYDEVTPGDKPDTMEKFLESLEKSFYYDSYQEERKRVNAKFNEVEYPCSEEICKRIIDSGGNRR